MQANIFDSGRFRVAVPDGWMAFCGIDSEGKATPKKVHIYKGAKLETDTPAPASVIPIQCLKQNGLCFSSDDSSEEREL